MSTNSPSPLLRRVLYADAAVSGVSALILIAGAGLTAGWLGLPEPLLRICGLLFVPFSAAVAFVATRQELLPQAVWAILIANAGWAIGSIAFLFSGWVAPTPLGTAVVVLQALVVAAFAELQFIGLRRPAAAIA